MPRFDHAFDWARRNVEDGPLPTAVLGVATAEGIAALDAFGGASVDDHYPLFSVTKPIVGLAAMRLIEQGRLTPETPLSDAVPEFGAGRDDVVRLRHLVSHTAGITEPPLDTPAGLRPSLLAPGRDFAAGTVSRYSTIAFEGVAALIEHATRESWERAAARVGESVGVNGFTLEAEAARHEVVDAAEQGLDYAQFAALRHPGCSAAPQTCSRWAARCSQAVVPSCPLSRTTRCCARSRPACRSSSRTPRAEARTGASPGTSGTPLTGCSPGTRSDTAAGPAASSGSRRRAASASRC